MNMRYRFCKNCFAGIALAALAAGPALGPDALVRRGNAAFDNGDYPAALESYLRAEERTIDPGLVAFNEATALYQLGRYREAELHFRRAEGDAEGSRRTRLLYNLGNSIVQQARNRHPGRLREAIGFYEKCLQQPEVEAALADDTRHNLELARLLLQKARSARENQNDSSDDQAGNPQQDEARNEARPGGDQPATTLPDSRGLSGSAINQKGDQNTAPAKTDQKPPPGKGNLPPIPDDDEMTALSPEDAVEYLKQAATRIQRERRDYRQRAVPASPSHVLDW